MGALGGGGQGGYSRSPPPRPAVRGGFGAARPPSAGAQGTSLSTGRGGGGGTTSIASRPSASYGAGGGGNGNQATAGDQQGAYPPGYREVDPSSPEYAEAKRNSAAQAQQAGKSKAEWMNDLYGTSFFMNRAEDLGNAQASWGSDWY